MYLESEIRFHKTKAANLETKVSRILQELAVTHSNVLVPAHIEQRVLRKVVDFTSEDAVSKCMQGMGRDSIGMLTLVNCLTVIFHVGVCRQWRTKRWCPRRSGECESVRYVTRAE